MSATERHLAKARALSHDSTHRAVTKHIAHAETDADSGLVDFGVGWAARTTLLRALEDNA